MNSSIGEQESVPLRFPLCFTTTLKCPGTDEKVLAYTAEHRKSGKTVPMAVADITSYIKNENINDEEDIEDAEMNLNAAFMTNDEMTAETRDAITGIVLILLQNLFCVGETSTKLIVPKDPMFEKYYACILSFVESAKPKSKNIAYIRKFGVCALMFMNAMRYDPKFSAKN